MDQYREKLGIKISRYNIYFLITKDGSENFNIARLEIDNTFNFKIEVFRKKKETKIIKTKFKAKTKTILKTNILEDFNNCHITIEFEFIIVV